MGHGRGVLKALLVKEEKEERKSGGVRLSSMSNLSVRERENAG